jgi:hypothetical protein
MLNITICLQFLLGLSATDANRKLHEMATKKVLRGCGNTSLTSRAAFNCGRRRAASFSKIPHVLCINVDDGYEFSSIGWQRWFKTCILLIHSFGNIVNTEQKSAAHFRSATTP